MQGKCYQCEMLMLKYFLLSMSAVFAFMPTLLPPSLLLIGALFQSLGGDCSLFCSSNWNSFFGGVLFSLG
jgi:hypothetical protein